MIAPRARRAGAVALSVGAASHLLIDGMLATPTGRLYHPMFWPLTQLHTPTPGLFHSTQPSATVASAVLAAVVVVITNPYTRE